MPDPNSEGQIKNKTRGRVGAAIAGIVAGIAMMMGRGEANMNSGSSVPKLEDVPTAPADVNQSETNLPYTYTPSAPNEAFPVPSAPQTLDETSTPEASEVSPTTLSEPETPDIKPPEPQTQP
ncbi:MAG TPA: hypothetical protein VLH19_05740 [Patescibacteria group bacterium]|nr:hypothetical protein [Patescibacteria group bacterium]